GASAGGRGICAWPRPPRQRGGGAGCGTSSSSWRSSTGTSHSTWGRWGRRRF
ncbi:unnamed protein product, partial [Tetraodon nigroviridis]